MKKISVAFYSMLGLEFGGGFERWVIPFSSALADMGDDVSIVTTDSTASESPRISLSDVQKTLQFHGVKYFRIPSVKIPFTNSHFPRLASMVRLMRVLKDKDVIYFVDAYFLQNLLIAFVKLFSRAKIITAYHSALPEEVNLDFKINRISDKPLKKLSSAFHVLNRRDARRLGFHNDSRLFVMPLGVDTERFELLPSPNKEKFRILFVGRITHQKGIDLLVDVISAVENLEISEQIEFLIVGSGPLSQYVSDKLCQFPNVRMYAHVSDQSLPGIYATQNLFIFPSRTESLGFVLLEAQSSGLPVVTANSADPVGLVIHNQTGYKVERNTKAFVGAIQDCFNLWKEEPERYEAMRERARKFVRMSYDRRVVSSRVRSLMIEVVEGNTHRR